METLLGYLPDWINKWGPLLLILLVLLYGLYLLIIRIIKSVQEVMTGIGKEVVVALEKPTMALNSQAQSMDRLTTSIKDYVGRDANEHQEIIILQKVIRQEIRETRQQTDDYMKKIKEQSDRIERYFKETPNGRS